MNPQDCLDTIREKYPCPAVSGYERAYWLYECRKSVLWIAGFLNEEYRKQIAAIQESGMTSKHYELMPIEKPESRVRIDIMREKYPEAFAELVYIKTSDAGKILGRKTLYALAKEKAGAEEIKTLEQVNVGDVERLMLDAAKAELIETRMKITDWAVLEKGT